MFSSAFKIRYFVLNGFKPALPSQNARQRGLQQHLEPQLRELSENGEPLRKNASQLVLAQIRPLFNTGVLERAQIQIIDSTTKKTLLEATQAIARPLQQNQPQLVTFTVSLPETAPDVVVVQLQLNYQQTSTSSHSQTFQMKVPVTPLLQTNVAISDHFVQLQLTSRATLLVDQKQARPEQLSGSADELAFISAFQKRNGIEHRHLLKQPTPESILTQGEVLNKVYRRAELTSRAQVQPRAGFQALQTVFTDVPAQLFFVQPPAPVTARNGGIALAHVFMLCPAKPEVVQTAEQKPGGLKLISCSVEETKDPVVIEGLKRSATSKLLAWDAELALVLDGFGQLRLEGWEATYGAEKRPLGVVVQAE